MLQSSWHRFRYACVNLASPIPMRAYLKDYAIEAGLRRLAQRHLIEAGLRRLAQRHLVAVDADGLYRAVPEESHLLSYDAGSIAHLTPPGETLPAPIRIDSSS